MQKNCDIMVKDLIDSFEWIENPGFEQDPERARLYVRATTAISQITYKLSVGELVSYELNVIVHAMGLFGGKEASDVRCIAATLGAALGVKFSSFAA